MLIAVEMKSSMYHVNVKLVPQLLNTFNANVQSQNFIKTEDPKENNMGRKTSPE